MVRNIDDISFRSLIKNAQKGDSVSLEKIKERVKNRILHFFLLLGIRISDAEVNRDQALDRIGVFIHLFEFRKNETELSLESRFQEWVYFIIFYSWDFGKKRWIPRTGIRILLEESGSPQVWGSYKLLEDMVLNFLERISVFNRKDLSDRKLLVLHCIGNLAYKEISDLVRAIGYNLNPTALRKRMNRAVERIREMIIVNALDTFLALKVSGRHVSPYSFFDEHAFKEYIGKKLYRLLKEEHKWFQWFKETSVDRKTFLLKTVSQRESLLSKQHFEDLNIYEDLADKTLKNRARLNNPILKERIITKKAIQIWRNTQNAQLKLMKNMSQYILNSFCHKNQNYSQLAPVVLKEKINMFIEENPFKKELVEFLEDNL